MASRGSSEVHRLSDVDAGSLARRISSSAPGLAAAEEGQLYALLFRRVWLYAMKQLRNEQDADDLAQQVLLTAIEKLRSGAVRAPDQIASFVLGTCRTMAIDWKRGVRRRAEMLAVFGPSLPVSVPPAEPLDTANLGRCLERLPARERAIVLLTFYADRSSERIAHDLALSAANVRVIRHRALGRLRDCVSGRQEGS